MLQLLDNPTFALGRRHSGHCDILLRLYGRSQIAFLCFVWLIALDLALPRQAWGQSPDAPLTWDALPDLPQPLGVAGPFVGVHGDVLLVAGGANFPEPVWENEKVWHSAAFALKQVNSDYGWQAAGALDRGIAYGASVSVPQGIICMGGNDAQTVFADCFLLSWNSSTERFDSRPLPSLPEPLAYGQACVVGDSIYLAGGQTTAGLDSALRSLWSLKLSALEDASEAWTVHDAWPGPPRAFNMTIAQNNGFADCLYMISGRYQDGENVKFLSDCWEYNPRKQTWRERASLPQAMAAGTGIALGQSHLLVLSGDSGALFNRTDELRDAHPGFPKKTFAYHTITDTWTEMGASPQNQVTTTAVQWKGSIVLPTGEIRPRVRSPEVWRITVPPKSGAFGFIDYTVLILYLVALVAIGVYFSMRTNTTDDYFRGGGRIPWWAAGCSIFATMLSSLTFTGIPSKAFAQDWVYAVGNLMIPLVAILAVVVALPFYRRIDATSAYEYLEKRFHRSLRLFGSLCFSTFHIFRMAIVMSLTGLALAVATPLTPIQSVLLMGVLSIVYCSLGGVSAVIWTDTLQTFVLLGGAFVAICWMLAGTGQGASEWLSTAAEYDKLNFANFHWDITDAQLALWVVIIGAIGQNTASYTADQAVVQRYMTTESKELAARAIWTNAVLTIPATLLFFGLGSSLFLYYRAHPQALDPTITTDQIFPLFISRELPLGLSGLIVAAIFAAAQSTVSTSMNSVATTLVTDFVRPLSPGLSERLLLRIAQVLTVFLGIAGTWLALSFVNPDIRSLFDQFIRVIGLFMGVLGGLFVLGLFFRRANAVGAWIGAVIGTAAMLTVWQSTSIQGYLYTVIGIGSCVVAGWLGSHLAKGPTDIENLCLGAR